MACESGGETLRTGSGNIVDTGHVREWPPDRLGLVHTLPNSTGLLFSRTSSSQEVEEEEHYAHDEDDVNEPCGNVQSEKPKQPKHDQDCCDNPKHL